MSSLASLVARDPLSVGDSGPAVIALQLALSQAGYRIGANGIYDGEFGSGTRKAVVRFQTQHGLRADGVVGQITAALLDAPNETLVATAKPMAAIDVATANSKLIGLPHDDTASLIAFYGNPDAPGFEQNIVNVTPPFPLTYAGRPWPHPIRFHTKCAPRFERAFAIIWEKAGRDPSSPILARVSKFSGSHVNRPVRGSSRKSCHAFGAALDVDAEDLPMGKRVDPAIIPQPVVDAFDEAGLFWGNRYVGRPDPMHWQAAHEG